MKVKELIEMLQHCDQELDIVVWDPEWSLYRFVDADVHSTSIEATPQQTERQCVLVIQLD